MIAEIIAIGSELLTPYRHDTNSLFLTERLNRLGVEVAFKQVVGDDSRHLSLAANTPFARADIVIFMGGLGPTKDDLTREAVAEALSLEIHRDPGLIKVLEQRFASRGMKMTENNLQQADVLTGATVLPNANGTAPGQWLCGHYAGGEKIVMLLPGPPREIKPLFDDQCMPRLRANLPEQFIGSRELKVAMMGESACDARIAPIYTRYKDVETTILAGAGEIQIHLRSKSGVLANAQKRVDELATRIEDELGEFVISDNGESMEQIVSYFLQMRGATLAVAESCTGGLLAQRLTSIGGSSRFFLGGAVVYSNELKTRLADVPGHLIEQYGAVSQEVASAMAEGIRERCGATLGVGITGVAGPTGGSDEKPVGLVFHALADENETEVSRRNFLGDRARIRQFASQQALDMIRRRLM